MSGNSPRLRPLLLAGLLAVGLGCAEAQPELAGREIAQRLVDDDPADFLDRTALLEATPVETWLFRDAADLEGWEPRRFDQRYELGASGLMLKSTRHRPRLRRQVDWPARSVDALAVEVPGFGPGISRLYWAGEGEKLSEERSVPGRLDAGAQPQTMVFDVVFHPAWRGRIRLLAIELFSPANVEFQLRAVRAVDYRPSSGAVAAAAAERWKIDLDHEVRNGLLALPATAVEHRLEVPPGAALRVGFGTETGARQSMVFSVQLDAGGETATLFEEPVDPEQSGRWHDREIDLSAFAGAEAMLRLAARAADGEHDLVHSFAFWSNPEVLAPAKAPAPNVVLISIDTLRADHLALYGYDRPTTPRLDAWAERRATVFANVVAPSPWTIPSHVSMFTGLDALRHGVNHPQAIPGRLAMMAEMLRDEGYATLAITGGGFMQPHQGFAQGFDRYRYWPDPKSEDEIDAGVDRALGWLDGFGDRPFLLFFHTFEVHYPYRRRQPHFDDLVEQAAVPPEVHLGFNNRPAVAEEGFLLSKQFFWKPSQQVLERSPASARELREVADRYDSGIAYADARLARLLERLEAGGLDRNTVVIITSDHGEALGERDLAGHAYLWDWNLLVPLVIALPEGRERATARIETQVRTVDLLPTVVELAGRSVPEGLDGVSLVPLLEGREAAHPPTAWSYVSFSNRGLALRFDNRLKYLYNNTAWAPLHGREQLYDLRRDPREVDDLVADRDTTALRRRARERLVEATAALEVRFTNPSDRAFSGRIGGAAIHPAVVKADALPAGALVWREVGRADFRVGPGEDFRLWLERPQGRLKFIGGFEGEAPGAAGGFDARLKLANFEGTWRLGHGSAGWSIGPDSASASAGDPTGIAVRWRGGSGPAVAAAGADARLLEQLRALGYLPD